MAAMQINEYPILVDQLCVGLFVRLETGGDPPPFPKKGFKIASDDEIETIRRLKPPYVICVSDKSDRLPIPLEDLAAGPRAAPRSRAAAPSRAKTPVSLELSRLKRETIEKNRDRRDRFAACEKQYDTTVSKVVDVLKRASTPNEEVMAAAGVVVDSLVGAFLSDLDVVVNLMTSKPREDSRNYHAVNVAVLALMLAREIGLGQGDLRDLGMGALFHDVGKGRVPIQRFSKGNLTTMNKVIEEYYREHPRLGVKLAAALPGFPRPGLEVILKHHEALDGSGFPSGLSPEEIDTLSRVTAIADTYDVATNREDESRRLTPHQALKSMYKKARTRLDPMLLATFIRNIGVYPPGSVVELSGGALGMVVSTNPKNSFRPSVLVHHPEIPKREALIIDLTIEEEIEIVRDVKPEELPRDIHAYLSPVRQLNYYVDTLPKG